MHRVVPEDSLKRRLRGGRLSPAESERTVRLANVIAQAEHVWVAADYQAADHLLDVTVEDDGLGVVHGEAAAGHYGLGIMRQRALSAHAVLMATASSHE